MRKSIIILGQILILLLSSCEHKDLCYHHKHLLELEVKFDWSKAPDANPWGMCIYFYPESEETYYRFDFKDITGGPISLPKGVYNVICYNNDTEAVLFGSTGTYFNHTLFTRKGDILESVSGMGYKASLLQNTIDEKVVITPDMMWGCAVQKVEVNANGKCIVHQIIDSETDTPDLSIDNESIVSILTFYPENLMCRYTYEIINVENIKYVTDACASLSGMSGTLNISSGELGTECVTLPLEATSLKDEKKFVGSFFTFGHHEDNVKPHKMLLYVWMNDGKKYMYGNDVEKFNVTEQIHNSPDKRRVHIVIDGLELPQAIENGHGFKPSVDDWDVVYEDIIM